MTRPVRTYMRNNLLGLFAIFIALGSGAYAAGLARDSVKSKQIKAGAVKNAELADNAVSGPKVANGSLSGEDFAPGQLPAGPQGPTGPTGPAGSDAPADGATVMTGRVQNSANLTCMRGAPTGFSLGAPCTVAGTNSRSSLIPTDKVASNFRVEMETAVVGAQASVFLSYDTGGGTSQGVAVCTIQPGQTACTDSQPRSVPAGSRLYLELRDDQPSFTFGYELSNPTGPG